MLSNDDGECEDPFNDGLFNDLLEEEKDTENFHAQFDNEKHYFASGDNPRSQRQPAEYKNDLGNSSSSGEELDFKRNKLMQKGSPLRRMTSHDM